METSEPATIGEEHFLMLQFLLLTLAEEALCAAGSGDSTETLRSFRISDKSSESLFDECDLKLN